jgi:hypothetical protein
MRGWIFYFLIAFPLNATAQIALQEAQKMNASRSQVYFTENKGQIHDGNYNPRPDVLFMGVAPGQQLIVTGQGHSHQINLEANYDGYLVKFTCNSFAVVTEIKCNDFVSPDGNIYTNSGTYTAIIPNSSGCDSIITIHLTIKNPEINKEFAITTCGDSTATASVSFNGGAAPFTYHWSSGSKDSIATNLWAGMHYVTVTDANGCTKIDSVFVHEELGLSAQIDKRIDIRWQNEVPMEVAFFDLTQTTNSGTKSIKRYWNFGDGNYSTAKYPVHVYEDE